MVEGRTLIDEVVAAGWSIEGRTSAPDVPPIDGLDPVFGLAPGVAERVSDLETSPGLFAVVALPTIDEAAAGRHRLRRGGRPHRRPGNLGTIMRSAEAAGAGAVVVTPGTVDAMSPKVVRASAGALFHVAVVPATLDAVRGGRAATRRHLLAPRGGAHRGRLDRSDRHRRRQRVGGLEPTTRRSTSGCASNTAVGPRA